MAYKGYFKPINPQKYRGNPQNIVYRSRWEFVFMRFLDKETNVLEWSSEEMFIPYKCRTDNKWHRYFPDFKVRVKNKDGKIVTQVIEIKPKHQTVPPARPPRKTKRFINEALTYAKNRSKWDYAQEWCKDRGYEFVIMTERELGLRF